MDIQQLRQKLEEQEHVHHAILAVLDAIHTTDSVSGLCQAVHAALDRFMAISSFVIALRDKNSGKINIAYRAEETSGPSPCHDYDALAVEVMQKKQALHFPGGKEADAADGHDAPAPSWFGVPLVLDEDAAGVLAVQCSGRPSGLPPQNRSLLESLAPRIASAIARKAALETLRHTEEQFHSLVANIPSIVFSTSTSGLIEFVSPALERLTGHKADHFRGRPWHCGVDAGAYPHLAAWLPPATDNAGMEKTLGSLIHPEDRARVLGALDAALAGTGTYVVEYRILPPGGRAHFVQETGRVVGQPGRVRVEGLIHDTHAQRSAQEINQVLFEISSAVNTTSSLEKLYEEIHKSLHRVIDATNFYIALHDRQRDLINFPYRCDVDAIDFVPQASTSKGYTAQVIFSGKPVLVDQEQIEELHRRFNADKRLGTPSKSWVGVPLKINNQVIGAMVCQSYTDPKRYTTQDILVLTSISDQVAIAIERGRSYEALRQSEEQLRALSLQTQQFGLAAAALLDKNDLQDILHSFCTAIVEHSGYTRSNITLLKKEPPYYESVNVGGLNPAAELDMTTPETAMSGFLKLFASGTKLGRSSYYVPCSKHGHSSCRAWPGEGQTGDQMWCTGDNIYVRMNDSLGNLLGVICVDSAKSGLQPCSETIRPLEVFSALISQIIIHKRLLDDLETARTEAEKATRAKSQFLANMSHEIRTPLNAILGLTDLVLDSRLSRSQASSLLKIQNAGKSLLGILNNVLDFSKIEAGMLHLEHATVSLPEAMRELFELLVPQAEAKQIEIIFHPAPSVPHDLHTDPLRLRQILMNLLNNAIKFTEEGHIVVFLDTQEEQDGSISVRFQIEDTGIGVPEAAMADLFESFAQADGSTTRRYGGTGLGLAITRQLVQLMGGNIWVRSSPGQGSTFGFSLPGQRKGRVESPKEVRRILVVDDNKATLRALESMLADHEVDTAFSEETALRLIRKQNHDFLLIKDALYSSCGERLLDTYASRYEAAPETVLMCGRTATGLQAEEPSPKRLYKPIRPEQLRSLINGTGAKNELSPRPARESISLTGKSLLVVEDNPVNQEVARRILLRAGADVAVAADGTEALNIMQSRRFDLVLMDIQMPRMDGYTATRKIREHFGPDTPIMAMTAHAMENNQEESLACGMNDFIAKPVDSVILLKKIRALLDGSQIGPDTPAAAPPASRAILNTDEAVERLNNDRQLYASLLQLFVQRHANIQELCQAVRKGDFDLAAKTLHTMRGAAATIGGGMLVKAIADLEQALARASTPAIEASLEEFIRAHTELLETISEPAPGTDSPVEAPPDAAHLRPILEELLELLRQNNLKADAVVLNLGRTLRGTQLQKWLDMLKEQVNNLHYQAAADMTQHLLDTVFSPGSDDFVLPRHEADHPHR